MELIDNCSELRVIKLSISEGSSTANPRALEPALKHCTCTTSAGKPCLTSGDRGPPSPANGDHRNK